MSQIYRDAVVHLTAPGAAFELVEGKIKNNEGRQYRHCDRNLLDVFVRGTAREAVALVYQGERFTFAELKANALSLASALATFGVEKGDRVAIAMRNLPEYVFAFWATQRIGAVLVGLNAWWVGTELAYALDDSKPKLLLADGERFDRLAANVSAALPGIIVTRPMSQPVGANVRLWDEFLASGKGLAPAPDILPDDASTMLYTSGTTGRPKGAISTHRNHASNLMSTKFFGAVARTMSGIPLDAAAGPGQPAALMPFPMFHIGGISSLYINMDFGSKLVLMRKWNADEAAMLIGRERVTSIALAPSMLRQLIDSPLFDTIDRKCLTSFATGSAPVSTDLASDARARFGAGSTPTVGYGLTETTSSVCANTGRALEDKPGSVGPPFPVTDVQIIDPGTGTIMEVGVDGEIWLRGPNVVDGYWNRPDASADAFVEGGWFRSGDIGHLDSDGFLYIVDRLKDVIIRGGENIYCVEVENALSSHPAVYEIAVIGAPEKVLGEAVVAIVVPTPGMLVLEDELIAFAKQNLAYFKVPSRIVFREKELERTPAGKVDKKILRAEFLTEAPGS